MVLGNSPYARLFLQKVYQLNGETLRDRRIATEIASALDLALRTNQVEIYQKALSYTDFVSDKDRLEVEMRKLMLIRAIDGLTNLDQE